MGPYKIVLSLVRPTIFCLILASAGVAFGQASSFTYQGRLQDGGTNANGSYDFQFTLWDALSGGTQQPQPSPVTVNRPGVVVAIGTFTVQLDFGTNAFPGAHRFLEISVRPSNSGNFTVLSPRHPITSTPYAVRSTSAGSADAAATATNATQLGGVAAAQYVITTDDRLSNARPPTAGNANYIQNTMTQQTANFNISSNGIIGGRLGVGTGNPIAKIHAVDNTSGSSAFFENVGAGQAIVAQGASTTSTLGGSEAGVLGVGNTGVTGRTFGNGDPVASIGVFGDAQSGSGINTGVWGQSKSSSGVGVRGWATSTTGSTIGVEGRSQSSSQSAIGVFGSGTTGVQGSGLTGVFGQSDTGVGLKGSAISGSSFLVPSAGVWGDSSSRTGVFGTSETLDGVHGTSASGVGGRFESQTGRGVEASGSTFGGFFTGRNGIGVDGGGNTHGGRFNSATGTGVHGFGGAFGGFFDTVGNGIGINVHSVGGVAILARSENTHALHADGSIFVNRWIVLNELRTGGGTQVCRNSSNELSSCSSSSIRYKKNIGSFDYGLDVVRRLRPISFDWKFDGAHDVGLVAEEVEKVAPQLTVYQNGQVEGVKYDKIGVVLINAVKEQQTQIQQQQEQLTKQQEHIKRQEEQSRQQRAALAAQQYQLDALKKFVCRSNRRAPACK